MAASAGDKDNDKDTVKSSANKSDAGTDRQACRDTALLLCPCRCMVLWCCGACPCLEWGWNWNWNWNCVTSSLDLSSPVLSSAVLRLVLVDTVCQSTAFSSFASVFVLALSLSLVPKKEGGVKQTCPLFFCFAPEDARQVRGSASNEHHGGNRIP